MKINHKKGYASTVSTFKDPILMAQGSLLGGEGSGSKQTDDEGQSPQEQPSEVSLHEYTDAFISFIGDGSGVAVLKSIE